MSNSGKIDKCFIVNSGKGGKFFIYNTELEKIAILENTEENRQLIAENTSFHLNERKYENDVCTLDESFGTLVFVSNTYRLYGLAYPKKNRRTKAMELTSKFIPMECLDNYKDKLLNSSGNLIDISNEKLYSHCKVKGLYTGFADETGNSVEVDKVNQFLQCRLNIAGNKEGQQLTENFKLEKEGKQSDINMLLDKISQLMEGLQLLDNKKEAFYKERNEFYKEREAFYKDKQMKEQDLNDREQEINCKEAKLIIWQQGIESLKGLYDGKKTEFGKVVNASHMWPFAREVEYEKIDYAYEYQLKIASINHTVRIPMSFYRKAVTEVVKILNANREYTAYEAIIAVRFLGDKDRNLLVVAYYDESAEFIDMVVLKEYTRFEVNQNYLAEYELQYRKWREDFRKIQSVERKYISKGHDSEGK